MRHHQFSVAALAIAGLISFPTLAQQTVTHVYRGVVTLVGGEQSDAIEPGEAVTVAYTLDPAESDLDPSPQAGLYWSGVQSMSVTLPDSDFAVLTGVGQLQTFDNTSNPDDQVSLLNYAIVRADDLQGLPVTGLELGFIGNTDMLSSDAVPTSRLQSHDVHVAIATARGWMQFVFIVTDEPEPMVSELVEDGILQLRAAVQLGTVARGVGNALATKLHLLQVAFDAGNTKRSCAMLHAFNAQLSGIGRAQLIDAALAAQMSALVRELDLAFGTCKAV